MAAAVIAVWWLVNHFDLLLRILRAILSILSPILIGLILAFILNLLLNPLERLWNRLFLKESSKPIVKKLRRPICLLLSFLIVLGVIFAVCFVVIPRLGSTVVDMVNTISDYVKTLDVRYDDLRVSLEQYAITLPEIDLGKNDLLTKLTDLLAKGGSALLNTTISVTTSVLSAVVNLLMGVVFSIYILAQKETLARQLKKLLYLTFPEQKVTPFLAFLGRVSRTFSQFITGQTIEAVILGTLVLLGMLILRLPYAPVIAVLVGVTALIPRLVDRRHRGRAADPAGVLHEGHLVRGVPHRPAADLGQPDLPPRGGQIRGPAGYLGVLRRHRGQRTGRRRRYAAGRPRLRRDL